MAVFLTTSRSNLDGKLLLTHWYLYLLLSMVKSIHSVTYYISVVLFSILICLGFDILLHSNFSAQDCILVIGKRKSLCWFSRSKH